MAWIYILYSEKRNKYYVGSTENIERRLVEHNRGHTRWTRDGIPWMLMHSRQTLTLGEARAGERYLKKMKSRVMLEKIIERGI